MSRWWLAVVAPLALGFGPALCSGPEQSGYWAASNDGVEDYQHFVRDSDGKILIMLMHAADHPDAPWGVYRDGAELGEFSTMDKAKAFAERAIGLAEQ